MNLLILTVCVAGARMTASWPPWLLPAVALAIVSVEIQLNSFANGVVSLPMFALAHAMFLGALTLRPSFRRRLRARGRMAARAAGRLSDCVVAGRDRRVAGIVLLGILAVLLARAILFLPEGADPYHLVRVHVLGTTHSLQHVPVADGKINALGYLYELTLADLTAGTVAGEWWLGLQGPLFVAVYFVAIAEMLVRARVQVRWPLFILACAVPAVFQQGVPVKNDLFAALLCLPAFVVLLEDSARRDIGRCAAAGFLTGLALATKVTTAPVALVLALFLPWRPIALATRTRLAALGGMVAGVAAGGLVLVVLLNVANYGGVGGPVSGTGNLPESVGAALLGTVRFVGSWLDMSVLTRRIWPGRGGWGGAFGPAFVWALVVLGIGPHERALARRTLLVVLTSLLAFGLLYPDADVAHRMALAPAVVAIVTAVTVAARDDRLRAGIWHLTALAAAVFALVLISRSSAAYLRQVEYLRARSTAIALEPQPGYLASRAVWQLREARLQLGTGRVCLTIPESALAMRGFDAVSSVVTVPTPDSYRHDWRADAIDRCDALLIGPNDYPTPDPAAAAALVRCTGRALAVSGPDVPIGAVRCRARAAIPRAAAAE